MYKELAGLVLRSILFLIVQTWNKFWVRLTTAIATAVNGEADSSRSSGAPILLQGEGMLTGDHASSSPQGTDTWSTNGELKLSRPITVAGAEREFFVEMFFKLFYTRSRTHTIVVLKLDQVDFGVRNCCTQNCCATNQQCGENCKTVFIHNNTIQVRPKSWAQDCRRMQLQPHHEAEVFGLQRSSTLNLQMPVVCPRQASFSYQIANTVSRAALAFGWLPACRDASNSVSWIWAQNRYANGEKLKFKWPRFGWGSRPLLGIRPSHMHFPPGSFSAEASWELPPCAELQQQCLEWDVTVSLGIAVFTFQAGWADVERKCTFRVSFSHCQSFALT